MTFDDGLKKLLWRCRRGTRELDLILTRFVNRQYGSLSEQQKKLFAQMLELPDPLLQGWLCNNQIPDTEEMEDLVKTILFTDPAQD